MRTGGITVDSQGQEEAHDSQSCLTEHYTSRTTTYKLPHAAAHATHHCAPLAQRAGILSSRWNLLSLAWPLRLCNLCISLLLTSEHRARRGRSLRVSTVLASLVAVWRALCSQSGIARCFVERRRKQGPPHPQTADVLTTDGGPGAAARVAPPRLACTDAK